MRCGNSAVIEEKWGDALFSSGETGCVAHYHAAMLALVPPGTRFESREENDRRMEAYTRISNKLYEVGPDGRARSYKPSVPEVKTQRREDVLRARQARTRQETELGRLHDSAGHHHHYSFAAMWHDAAKALARVDPSHARTACDWIRHFFELYRKSWIAHLPASRWDSDGTDESSDVQTLKDSITPCDAVELPDWVRYLLAGDVRHAVDARP